MSRTLQARVSFPAECQIAELAPKPRDKFREWAEVLGLDVARGDWTATELRLVARAQGSPDVVIIDDPIMRVSRYFDRHPEMQIAALTTSPKNWKQLLPVQQSLLEELQCYADEDVRATRGVLK